MEITRFQSTDEATVQQLQHALYEPLQLAAFQWQPCQQMPTQTEWADKLEFALARREQIEGRDTLVVTFRQRAATPLVAGELVERQLSSDFKTGWQRWRGRFWLNAASGQITRIEQERTLEYADTIAPLVVRRETLEFAPSKYGIPIPKRFVADWNFHSWRDKSGARQLARRVRFTDEYGAFQRFATDGRSELKR